MRTMPFRAASALLLCTTAFRDAALTSFPLGIPFGIETALDPCLRPVTLEITSGCNYTTSMLKRYEPNTERAIDLVVIVETTNVSTSRFEGKDKDTSATATDSDRKLYDALPVSQKKVYLGGDQPDGCPEDLDTPHCDECGGTHSMGSSFDGVSRCRGIADKDMQWADCICVDTDFSHSEPLTRRGERMMSPHSLETLRLIEEYGSDEEDEPIDLDADSTEVGNADRTTSQVDSSQGHECNSAIEHD